MSRLVDLDYAEELGLTETDLDLVEDLDPIGQKETEKPHYYPRDAVDLLHSIGTKKRETLKLMFNQKSSQQVEQYSQECRQFVASWKLAKPTLGYSKDSKLPLDVWSRILGHLCDDMRLDDVRGPSVVARDLCNASMTCKDLYAASLPAFQRLSSLCAERKLEHQWQCLLSDPCNSALLPDKDITGLLESAKLRHFGSREVRLTILYRSVNQTQPTRLPARLILTVLEEETQFNHLIEASKLKALSASQRSDFHYRAKLTQLGVLNLNTLKELYNHWDNYEFCKDEANNCQTDLEHHRWQMEYHGQQIAKAEKKATAAKIATSEGLRFCQALGFDTEGGILVSKQKGRIARKPPPLPFELQSGSSESFSRLLHLLFQANFKPEQKM